MSDRYPPIGDYGAIGDCRTLALVSRAASIDWWCEPRFDAPSLFGRILDRDRGGSLHLEGDGLAPDGRRYLPDSAILETSLKLRGGRLQVTDFLAVVGKSDDALGPIPYARQKLVRLVKCTEGSVAFTLHCVPRPGYGLARSRITLAGPAGARRRSLALRTPHDRRAITLGATVDWAAIRDRQGRIEAMLDAGEEIGVVIDYGPGDLEGEGVSRSAGRAHHNRDRLYAADEIHAWLSETARFWRDWTAVNAYDGPYRELVARSAITLKLLTYHPSGAIVAAGTTSLPEEIGGERNWDYRFTWLRDASFTLYALHTLGYRAESDAFMRWITRAASRQRDPRVLYRVNGHAPGRERELRELEGYRGSRPVRVGNEAARQHQLDLYGAVLDAAYLDRKAGNPLDDGEWAVFARFADLAASRWRTKDTSIWEVRGGARDFTFSKVMCWVALDRACRIADMIGKADAEADRIARWKEEAAAVRRAVLDHGRRPDGAFVQFFGSDRIDASALLFPLVGFIRATAPSAAATFRAVRAELEKHGLVLRYRADEAVEGVAGLEGYFLMCSYWLCDNLLLAGQLDEARQRFEDISAHANDLGLFSEEWDPTDGIALGNFPQAFTHIALISTAHNLERARKGRLHGSVRRDAPSDD